MYTSLIRGIPDKHSLSHELRLKYSGGMYFYKPKQKPFDITKHEWSDGMANLGAMMSERGDVVIRVGSSWIFLDKKDGIAISKALGLTAEDLK